jgi:hypothetical protein
MMKALATMLILAATAMAQISVPRVLHIYKKGGALDTVAPADADSVTFSASNKLVVHRKSGVTDSICVAQIDSVTFPYFGGPAITLLAPTPGATLKIGDTLVLSWTINPICIQDRVSVLFSTHDGGTASADWHELCVPAAGGGACQPSKSDATIYSGNTATMKIELTASMSGAGGTDAFSPVSDSCRIKLSQYESGGYVPDLSAVSGRFSVRP